MNQHVSCISLPASPIKRFLILIQVEKVRLNIIISKLTVPAVDLEERKVLCFIRDKPKSQT